jgi:L-fucose dehydrogenase
MDLNLKHKKIIITGGTQGIGGAISRILAEEGAIPIFIGRKKETGEALVEELREKGQESFFIQADLSEKGSCKMIVEKVLQEFKEIHALVNNAGINDNIGLEKGSPEKFQISLLSNLQHYYDMAHYCLPALKESKGNILNISSKVALSGQGGTSGYAAAKGAQTALTREWAAELLPYKIRVNAILPAEVATPQYKSWLESFDNPKEKKLHIENRIPFEHRMTTPEEIAWTAAFLLSDKSSHTTGQLIVPDGGYLHLDRSLT